jgi:hypothetical protein
MWGPQPPATLRASTACTGINLPFTLHKLRVFENRVLWRIFGQKWYEVQEVGEKCIMRSIISIIRMIKSRRMR